MLRQFHQWFKKASNIRSLILSVGNMKDWEPLYYTHGSKQNLKRFIILHETGFVIIQPFLLSSTCCWCEPVCSGSSAGGEQDLIQVLHKKPTVCLVISQSNMLNLSCTFINLSKMSQKKIITGCVLTLSNCLSGAFGIFRKLTANRKHFINLIVGFRKNKTLAD